MSIADIRREYTVANLRRTDLHPDPIEQFKLWFDQAAGRRAGGGLRRFFIRLYKTLLMLTGTEPMDVNAAALATADANGRPAARMVLLKGVDERGFVFFTNYESAKGRHLDVNPHAALVFYWSDLERQVCVAGAVERISRQEAEAYFQTRPKGSQLAAWASRQGEIIKDRAVLEQRFDEAQARYPDNTVPLPPYWGGYRVVPNRIEFWQGRANRLHDRFRYTKQADQTWRIDRLSP